MTAGLDHVLRPGRIDRINQQPSQAPEVAGLHGRKQSCDRGRGRVHG